ncbi:XkdX family protein [Brevibacillus agri]
MIFWRLAYNLKWVTIDKLRLVVRTELNPFGEITPDEFKQITGKDF